MRRGVLWLACLSGFVIGVGAACDGCAERAGDDGGREGEGEGAGEGEGEDDDVAIPGAVALRLTPTTANLLTDGTDQPEQDFVVQTVFDDGRIEDATGRVAWRVSDQAVGVMRDATFVSAGIGGSVDVTATAGGLTATARVTVQLRTVLVGDGNGGGTDPAGNGNVPADAADFFDDDGDVPVDAGRAPELVYPNDGVLLPRNLGTVEFHWRKGSPANSLFAVTFASSLLQVQVITRCVDLAGGCVYEPSLSLWRLLADTHAGLEPVSVSVQGTDDQGTALGVGNRIAVSFSAAPVEGGLYYWTTSGSTAIMRVDFGAAAQVPEKFFPFEGNDCYGCHALSPDGRKMSLSRRGIGQGQLGLIDIGAGSESLGFTNDQREQFQSWRSDSSLFVGIFGDTDDLAVRHRIRIHDGDSGAVVEAIDLDHEPDHPDWSPVEDRITYTKVTHHASSQRPGRGGLNTLVKRDGVWQPPVELVPPETGRNRYAPATSLDGRFLTFVESRCGAVDRVYGSECDADADPTARLFGYALAPGAVVELARANAPGRTDGGADLSNTFPKWAPFEGPRGRDGSGRVQWMTFSSRRNYGLRTNDPQAGRQLLWMVAVDPDAVVAGEDGSFPGFALPFQDIQTSNHMAQWTRAVVALGCNELATACDPTVDNPCCGSAVCRDDDGDGAGVCGPAGPGEGEGEGEAPVCAEAGASCARLPCCAGFVCLPGDNDATCAIIDG